MRGLLRSKEQCEIKKVDEEVIFHKIYCSYIDIHKDRLNLMNKDNDRIRFFDAKYDKAEYFGKSYDINIINYCNV